MRNQNSITHSEYTLKKTKEYILKNVDIIKIKYDLIYLYEEDIDEFERIKKAAEKIKNDSEVLIVIWLNMHLSMP